MGGWDMKIASWVVVDKSTGKAVFETFKQSTANAINRDKYQAIPIDEYLPTLNRQTPRHSATPLHGGAPSPSRSRPNLLKR